MKITKPNASGLSCTLAIQMPTFDRRETMSCRPSHSRTQADLDAGHYANQACVDDGAAGAAQACDSVDTPGTPNPHLAITKSFSPASYSTVGQTISYTIRSDEHTYELQSHMHVTYPHPSGLNCTPATSVANLAPDSTITCTASHTVTQADLYVFFFNDTATTEIYTLSLHRRSSDLDTPGTPNPHLAITKSFSPASYSTVGQTISYTI